MPQTRLPTTVPMPCHALQAERRHRDNLPLSAEERTSLRIAQALRRCAERGAVVLVEGELIGAQGVSCPD